MFYGSYDGTTIYSKSWNNISVILTKRSIKEIVNGNNQYITE